MFSPTSLLPALGFRLVACRDGGFRVGDWRFRAVMEGQIRSTIPLVPPQPVVLSHCCPDYFLDASATRRFKYIS